MRELDITVIDFEKGDGLVPAIVQDAETNAVLMLAYMNKAALEATLETGLVTFFSRSRQNLWQKGESSGNTLTLKTISLDCDGDTLLIKTSPAGPVCHLGDDTCFQEENTSGITWLEALEGVIAGRKGADPASSYTARLFDKGVSEIAKKVGEEGVETALAGTMGDKEKLTEESADLIYHLLVLLAANEVTISDVVDCLKGRHQAA